MLTYPSRLYHDSKAIEHCFTNLSWLPECVSWDNGKWLKSRLKCDNTKLVFIIECEQSFHLTRILQKRTYWWCPQKSWCLEKTDHSCSEVTLSKYSLNYSLTRIYSCNVFSVNYNINFFTISHMYIMHPDSSFFPHISIPHSSTSVLPQRFSSHTCIFLFCFISHWV